MNALVAIVGARQFVESHRECGIDVTAAGVVVPLARAPARLRAARR